jgi:hypothetical protein
MIKGRSGPARMKRAAYMIAGGIILLSLTSFTLLKIRVGQDVKDEHNTPGDRSRVAIWTLGRIKSEKALPLLRELYRDDPRGETCYGRHDSVLCQYEIRKAITSMESFRIFTYSRFN